MSTFQDLEAEVRKLKRKLARLEADPNVANEQAVVELTNNDDKNSERQSGMRTGHGFGKLMDEVRAKDHERTMENAEAYARENSGKSEGQLKKELNAIYGLWGDDLASIVDRYKR